MNMKIAERRKHGTPSIFLPAKRASSADVIDARKDYGICVKG